MTASTLEDMIRGDVALARAIFGDERKRRLIPQLQRDGWPIFDVAGKRCGFPADLRKASRRATRKAQRRQRRSKSTKREAASAAPEPQTAA